MKNLSLEQMENVNGSSVGCAIGLAALGFAMAGAVVVTGGTAALIFGLGGVFLSGLGAGYSCSEDLHQR